MSDPLEQLRLAAALAHSVAGVELRLHRGNGAPLIVSRGSEADIDPCQLRHIVAAHRCPMQRAAVSRVSSIEVGGSVASYGGDLYASSDRGVYARWFVTLLDEARVGALVGEAAEEVGASDSMAAYLRVDPALGVTVVSLVADSSEEHFALGRLAAGAYRRCVVDELIGAVDPAHVAGN